MNASVLPTIYCNLLKLQPLYSLKKVNISRLQLRSLSYGLDLPNPVADGKNSELIFTGVEHIQKLQPVSKKYIKLSKVEEKDIPVVESLKKENVHYPYKSPEERMKKIFLEDGKIGLRKAFKFVSGVELGSLEHVYFHRFTDILIIGGGPTGLLIAHAIRSQFPHGPKVTVLDKFESFPRPSINLSQGMVTKQLFSEEEEISILQYGIEFFSSFQRHTEINNKQEFKLPYEPMGTLVLAEAKNAEQVLAKNEILKNHGIKNKILNRSVLQQKFPWLNIDDVLFGSLGMCNEGLIDPWMFLYGIKCKCINLGVHFASAEAIDFGYEHDDPKRVVCKLPDGTYNSIDFAYCIIAGGIESLNLVHLFNSSNSFELGLKLPLEERLRYEYCFYSPKGPGVNTPIVIDSNDTYFRREGLTGHYVAGVPSVIDNGENNPYHVFETTVRPFLMKRMPHFSKFELVKGWIDTYEYCFSNKVGITGSHPETHRIVFALGFSHFGLLLLPALARAIMEFVVYDEYQTIDFSCFHIDNLWKKHHLEAERKRRELLEAESRIPLADPLAEKKKLEATSR